MIAPEMMLFPYNNEPETGSRIPSRRIVVDLGSIQIYDPFKSDHSTILIFLSAQNVQIPIILVYFIWVDIFNVLTVSTKPYK